MNEQEKRKYYGIYIDLVNDGFIRINTDMFKTENMSEHFYNILNIMRDMIETEAFREMVVNVQFGSNPELNCNFRVPDYYSNLILWQILWMFKLPIEPKHIFFEKSFTRRAIKNYIDTHFIIPYRVNIDSVAMNNSIDDILRLYTYADEFSLYLANTTNLEDYITLMNKNPEFDAYMHLDISNIPLEEQGRVTMDVTDKIVDIIMASDHCLKESFITGEGTNKKQFREFAVSIGSKPNGMGGVFPSPINASYINGGLSDIASLMIESWAGRIAQMLSKTNVGTSGHFARLLGLNNQECTLHEDPHYVCDTKNFQILTVVDEMTLNKLYDRYYRFQPDGEEYKIRRGDTFLLGKTIYLRSPMTCASLARGEGICYRCYGDLAYSNKNINVGKYAAEILSSILTQMLLSAKHLLESKIKKLDWSPEFYNYFVIDGNIICIDDADDDTEIRKTFTIAIERIEQDSDYDDKEYNDFVTEFYIIHNGVHHKIYTQDVDKMYLTHEFMSIIEKTKPEEDGFIYINSNTVKDTNLFLVIVHNNELTKTLEKIKDTVDKIAVTCTKTRHELLQFMLQEINNGNLNIMSVHCETILANQIRDTEDILERPDWTVRDKTYQNLTLKQALTNNPSLTITLAFEKLGNTLYSPQTFKKRRASFMDLFFMEKPQLYLRGEEITTDRINSDEMIDPVRIVSR